MTATSRSVTVLLCIVCWSCGGHRDIEGDATEEPALDPVHERDVIPDPIVDPVVEDMTEDIHVEDVVIEPEPEIPPPPNAPDCGNGLIDEGEECDDGNRLDGDGCDWLCRLGDGDPPAPCSDGVADYVPEGAEVALGDLSDTVSVEIFPLAWSGSEFAAVFWDTPGDVMGGYRMRRFDTTGRVLARDWTHYSDSSYIGHDLVWNGSGYGLFYVDSALGIVLVRLDPGGEPVAEPVVVVPDPMARVPSADVTEDGYVLVWAAGGTNPDVHVCICSTGGCPTLLNIRRLGSTGSTAGFPGPITLTNTGAGIPKVATGSFGYGITDMAWRPDGECALMFMHVSEDLAEVVRTGYLARGTWHDLDWVDDGYIVPFPYWLTSGGEIVEGQIAIARFTAHGILSGPPYRNGIGRYLARKVRLAKGDGGLFVVASAVDMDSTESLRKLLMLRTDLDGCPISPLQVYPRYFGPEEPSPNIVWADSFFGVIFNHFRADTAYYLKIVRDD